MIKAIASFVGLWIFIVSMIGLSIWYQNSVPTSVNPTPHPIPTVSSQDYIMPSTEQQLELYLIQEMLDNADRVTVELDMASGPNQDGNLKRGHVKGKIIIYFDKAW